MDSLLVRNSVVLTVGRNASIRRAVNEIEDIVKRHSLDGYAQPQVVPVPDDFEPEMPRMLFSSKAGFSQLLVSQVSVTFNTNYSPDWMTDPDKCLQYLLSKVGMLFEIVAVGWKDSPMPAFTGITTSFLIKTDTAADAIRLIAPTFSDAAMLIDNANEVSYRWSLNVDSKFYSNIAVATTTILKSPLSTIDTVQRYNEKTIEGYGVEIIGDYNDRLAYNSGNELVSDAENAIGLIKSGFSNAMDAVKSISNGAE